MKSAALILSLLVVWYNHLTTTAQSNNTTMITPTAVDMTNISNTLEIPSMTINDTINMTAMESTIGINDSMSITTMETLNISMTLNMTEEVTMTVDLPSMTPTSSFIMTMTTNVRQTSTTMFTSSTTILMTSSIEPSTSSGTSPGPSTTSVSSEPTPVTDEDDSGLSTGVIIGIAAGGGAAVLVILIIICCCCCCCYQKRHREESYNIGPTVTARYWDANHPNDAGPGHVTSGGSMRSRASWRDSLRSFTRGSLRRSLSLRRSSKRAKDKQQPSEYIGLYSTPL